MHPIPGEPGGVHVAVPVDDLHTARGDRLVEHRLVVLPAGPARAHVHPGDRVRADGGPHLGDVLIGAGEVACREPDVVRAERNHPVDARLVPHRVGRPDALGGIESIRDGRRAEHHGAGRGPSTQIGPQPLARRREWSARSNRRSSCHRRPRSDPWARRRRCGRPAGCCPERCDKRRRRTGREPTGGSRSGRSAAGASVRGSSVARSSGRPGCR